MCLERPATAKGRRRQASSGDLYGEYTTITSSLKSPTRIVASSMKERTTKAKVKAGASSQPIECSVAPGLPPLSPAGSPIYSPGRYGFHRDQTFSDWQDGPLSPSASPLQSAYPPATSSSHAHSSPSLSLQPVHRVPAGDGSPAPMGPTRRSRRHQSFDVAQVTTLQDGSQMVPTSSDSPTGSFKSPRCGATNGAFPVCLSAAQCSAAE